MQINDGSDGNWNSSAHWLHMLHMRQCQWHQPHLTSDHALPSSPHSLPLSRGHVNIRVVYKTQDFAARKRQWFVASMKDIARDQGGRAIEHIVLFPCPCLLVKTASAECTCFFFVSPFQPSLPPLSLQTPRCPYYHCPLSSFSSSFCVTLPEQRPGN